tara:strand:- start:73 stop:882 length:810 start_codon:yes stop_codon:yes gene_type:complete
MSSNRQNKKLGQVFLKDPTIIDAVLDYCKVQKQETLVEIGCGDGILTKKLLPLCDQLFVYEIDPFFIEQTQKATGNPSHLQFIQGDVIKLGLKEGAKTPFSLIANIPYQISAPLMEELSNHKETLKESILMLQAEFAEKLSAIPSTKAYSRISIFTHYHFDVETILHVPKTEFHPVPKVDSTVVRLIPRKKPPFTVDEKLFFTLIKTAFFARRKTLQNCLQKAPFLRLKEGFSQTPFLRTHPKIRGEALSLDDFYTLYTELLPFIEKKE